MNVIHNFLSAKQQAVTAKLTAGGLLEHFEQVLDA
jgi:hypothetical protein